MCATCHAKMVPLSTDFARATLLRPLRPRQLEHPDFYPDGRDLGENYTFTSWSMSPCLKSGKLDCNHCHTPSGRPRFEMASPTSRACPATSDRRGFGGPQPSQRSAGNSCIACHMPMSRFAAMRRTDHSMRRPCRRRRSPTSRPTPATSAMLTTTRRGPMSGSANGIRAITRQPVLKRAGLLDAARHDRWSELPAMLAALEAPKTDPVWKASMLSLLQGATSPAKWPSFLKALGDPSPLVRSRAATALGGVLSQETVPPLIAATRDASRLVRIRPRNRLPPCPWRVFKTAAIGRASKRPSPSSSTP